MPQTQDQRPRLYIGLIAVIFVLVALTLLGGASQRETSESKLKIVATTSQLGDIVKNIAGGAAEVQVIFKPGIDPHEYQATGIDAAALESADIIVENGLGLELSLEKAISRNTRAKKFTASNSFSPLVGEGDGGGHGAGDGGADGGGEEFDPHFWFSVKSVAEVTLDLGEFLASYDAAHAHEYMNNARSYYASLLALDAELTTALSEIPTDRRLLVTNHDTFAYFARDYGFQIVGAVIPSLSTDAATSAKDFSELLEKLKSAKVKAVFAETSVNPKLVESLAAEAGIKVGKLYGDSLGEPGSEGDSYLKMMRYNGQQLVDNLK